jgi:hypothetical protein
MQSSVLDRQRTEYAELFRCERYADVYTNEYGVALVRMLQSRPEFLCSRSEQQQNERFRQCFSSG